MSTSRRGGAAPYHHGDLRRALLAAARALLEAGGPEAVTLREAARTACVSHNAPYRHFASRDALLAALAAEGFVALAERLRDARARAASEPLPALGRAYLGFAEEERARFRLMFGGSLERAAHPALAAGAAEAFGVLRDSVASGTPPERVGPAGIHAWGLVHGLATLVADGQIGREEADAALGRGAGPG